MSGVWVTHAPAGPETAHSPALRFDTIRLGVEPPAEKQSSRLMRAMFDTVAPRYDFITRAFSYGMDIRWKQQGVQQVTLPSNPVVLDLASGTGDFSQIIKQVYPGGRSIAVDLTHRM